VDVRVITATHRALAAMVEAGTFREDLYYRLDVFSIAVPSLRERRGDLGPLINVLLRDLAGKLGMPVPSLSRTALAKLETHDWPGNVRELMNVLESALILGGGRTLELPDELRRRRRTAGDAAPFDVAVRAAIEEVLRATRGKLYGAGGAAERLGLKPGTLQSKMRKLGIERRRFT